VRDADVVDRGDGEGDAVGERAEQAGEQVEADGVQAELLPRDERPRDAALRTGEEL
jgi:hypothetical protein